MSEIKNTKYGKEIIAEYHKRLDNEKYTVIVTNGSEKDCEGENYYDIHVITDKFNDDEFNTLYLQEPYSRIENPKEYFNRKYLIAILMEFFIWDKFYDEGVVTSDVRIIQIDPHDDGI